MFVDARRSVWPVAVAVSDSATRLAVRWALTSWGMDDPDRDAELLASEIAANAAEHAGGPVGLTLRRHAQPGGQSSITCEVTDTSPDPPRQRRARPDEERGRGLAILTALADVSGVRAGPGRQDHLVHPRPPRAHRASRTATRTRSRGRSLTAPRRRNPPR